MSEAAPELTTVERVKQRYKALGLDKGWTLERFNRLCKYMNVLPEELAALCCVSSRELRGARKAGRFMPSTSLHFVMIEGFIIEFKTGLKTQPAMPLDWIVKK